MKKLFIVLIAVAVFIVLGVAVAFWLTGDARKAAKSFAETFSRGDVNEAYAMTSPEFQKEFSGDEFRQIYEDGKDYFTQIKELKINSISVVNGNQAEAEGYIKNGEGLSAPVMIKMAKWDGQWKVYEFNFDFGAASK